MRYTRREVAYAAALAALGTLLGLIAIPIGPTTVTFGEVSYVLVGVTLGPGLAVVVAFLGSLYTLELYGNIFGTLSWILVAPVFSYLCVRRGVHPVLGMALAGLVAVPVSLLLVPWFLGTPVIVAYLLALKSYLNRVVVAGIVVLLLSRPQFRAVVPFTVLPTSWFVRKYGQVNESTSK
jgi:predicted membrane protein